MSNKGKKTVTCPHCGKSFDADFWTVVRGDLDFELKEMIINGEFDLLLCPECNKLFSYEDTFVYIDPVDEIMAFVMPEKNEGSSEIMEKVKADYEIIKSENPDSLTMAYKPYYFWGAESLAELLLNDRDIEEETEVMEFMAKERGFPQKEIKKSVAREKNFLFSIPYEGSSCCVSSAVSACEKLLKENDSLKRLSSFLNFLRGASEEDFKSLLKK